MVDVEKELMKTFMVLHATKKMALVRLYYDFNKVHYINRTDLLNLRQIFTSHHLLIQQAQICDLTLADLTSRQC